MIEELRSLDWEDYTDFRSGLLQLMAPLRDKFAAHPGRLKLGYSGTHYREGTRQMEAFSRTLWGLGPFLSQNQDPQLQASVVRGIAKGCDPHGPDYWGLPKDSDQLLVEMAAVAVTLLVAKAQTWDQFSSQEKDQVAAWLLTINERDMPANNWHFFRVLVNVAMKKMGMPHSADIMEADLELLESYYQSDGWYYDGRSEEHDYYIPWAFHFYGLVYAKFMADEDSERADRFKQRARAFAQSYRYWFDKTGEAIPFGRSLTYRFAQSAFWAALVFADVEALPWGQVKGLIARNFRRWMGHEIFTVDGRLSIGYHYENLVMGEGYNGPGSPYWALKPFILLAVAQDHPFWSAPAEELSLPSSRISLPSMRATIEQADDSAQAVLYPAGQFMFGQAHAEAKYGKFAYSTVFGFSTPKSNLDYPEGAYDSTLAVSPDDHHFRPKGLDDDYQLDEDRIIHHYSPMPGVSVTSTVIPCGDSHVRIHEVDSDQPLNLYDAGFSAPWAGDRDYELDTDHVSYESAVGTVAAYALNGFKRAELVTPEPNTNLFFEESAMPALRAELPAGHSLLVSLMVGAATGHAPQLPTVSLDHGTLSVRTADKTTTIPVKE